MRSWRVHGDHGISSDVRAGASVGLSMDGGSGAADGTVRAGGGHGCVRIAGTCERVNVCINVYHCRRQRSSI